MLVEHDVGWLLIDHKTDVAAYAKACLEQLSNYHRMCTDLRIDNLAINWARNGKLEKLK